MSGHPCLTSDEEEFAEWCRLVDAHQRLRDLSSREPVRCGAQGTPLMPETRREMGVGAPDFGPVLG